MTVIPIRPGDTRIVYGARCTWWDSIANVSTRNGLPCCPHCRNVLFEMDGEERFISGAEKYEAFGHPGYVAMLKWARGKCFPTLTALQSAYRAAQGEK